MTILETLRMAASALRANRARSALTVLSITIGAFAIVVMSSLAESGLRTLDRGVEELGGARILLAVQKTPERAEDKKAAYASGWSLADRDRLFHDLPHVVDLSLFSRLGKREVMAESGLRATTSLVAVDARFFDVFRMKVGRGRAFTEDENRGRQALCVVGHKLAAKIGPLPDEPLGRFLSVGSLRCRVVGVLADNDRFGVGFGFDWTDLVLVPSETMGDFEARVLERASVLVQTDSPSSNELVKRLINTRLSARHPGIDDFTLFDFSGFMDRFRSIYAAMELIVALLAGIALFIGGVGVMNMMLVAVSERVREIGLRKALGARPSAIGAQFLTESVMLSAFGGGAGVLAGVGVAALASALIGRFLTSWQPSMAPWASVAALSVSIGIGVLFGWLPARKAAQLDPIQALRR
jgi:putative ABC transport system permease protein